jgi:hypothetical protein
MLGSPRRILVKLCWIAHPAKFSLTHMVDFLQDSPFSIYIFFEFWLLLDCFHGKHFACVL